jgi:hypothetical protein
MYLGVTTLDTSGAQPPVALIDAGVSFVQPNWYYNVAVRNQSATTSYDVLADVWYQIAALQNPGFYGGTYDDATTLTYTWTQQTAAPAVFFQRIDGDDTGATAVTHAGSNVYVTTNYGSNWTIRNTGFTAPFLVNGTCGARSSSSILYAALLSNAGSTTTSLFKSTDTGSNWGTMTSAGARIWRFIKCNYTGTIVLAGQNNGNLYLSRDSGATWTAQTTGGSPIFWSAGYVSDDGRVLAATASAGGNIWVSIDGGTTWTPRASPLSWGPITGTSDGSILCAGSLIAGGTGVAALYLSTDFGTTWTTTSTITNASVSQIEMSINGNKLVAVGTNFVGSVPFLILSQDGGSSWSTPAGAPTGNRQAIAMNPDGTRLILGGNSTGSLRPYTAIGV